jgi:hypothetical protein
LPPPRLKSPPPTATAIEITAPETAASRGVVDVDHVGAVENLDAIDARPAEADAKRFAAPELVRRLEKDLAVAFERQVALPAAHRSLDLNPLDVGQLVLAADRLARFCEERRAFGDVFGLTSRGNEGTKVSAEHSRRREHTTGVKRMGFRDYSRLLPGGSLNMG